MSLNNSSIFLLTGIFIAVIISAFTVTMSVRNAETESDISIAISDAQQVANNVSAFSAKVQKTQSKLGQIKTSFKKNLLSACESKTTSQDHCRWGTATAYNDSSICRDISTNTLRDSCFLSIASETGDNTLCDRVQQRRKTITCRAVANESVSLCDDISDNYEQTRCVNEVAKYQGSASVCSNVSNNNDYNISNCLTRVAIENRDPQFCEQICENPTGKTSSNVASCDSAEEAWKDSCFMKVGIVSRNESICNQIHAPDEYNYCLGLVKENQSYCDKISNNESYTYNCNAILNSEGKTDYGSLFN